MKSFSQLQSNQNCLAFHCNANEKVKKLLQILPSPIWKYFL